MGKKCIWCDTDIEDGEFCEECAYQYWKKTVIIPNQKWWDRLENETVLTFLYKKLQPLLDTNVEVRTRHQWGQVGYLHDLITELEKTS